MQVDEDHLEGLLDACDLVTRIVPLRELVDRWRRGASTAGLTALTFDDAYASLIPAKAGRPSRLDQLPRTLFVVTGNDGQAFWWDRIDDLDPYLDEERWRKLEDEAGVPDAYRRGQPRSFGRLRPLRQWILFEHRGAIPRHLSDLIEGLEEDLGRRTAQRAMRLDEVAAVASDPLVEIGVHTVTHRVLPLLPDAELVDELRLCQAALLELHPSPLPVLAVPFGLFDTRTVRCAKNAGIDAVLTLEPRTLVPRSQRSTLPRFCLTSREPRWKLQVKISGVVDWFRSPRERFPSLPSPTT